MKTVIYLKKVNMSSVNSNAGVFYGDNKLRGWQSRSKGNNALGRVNGDGNRITSCLNFIHDPDIIDMSIKTGR